MRDPAGYCVASLLPRLIAEKFKDVFLQRVSQGEDYIKTIMIYDDHAWQINHDKRLSRVAALSYGSHVFWLWCIARRIARHVAHRGSVLFLSPQGFSKDKGHDIEHHQKQQEGPNLTFVRVCHEDMARPLNLTCWVLPCFVKGPGCTLLPEFHGSSGHAHAPVPPGTKGACEVNQLNVHNQHQPTTSTQISSKQDTTLQDPWKPQISWPWWSCDLAEDGKANSGRTKPQESSRILNTQHLLWSHPDPCHSTKLFLAEAARITPWLQQAGSEQTMTTVFFQTS